MIKFTDTTLLAFTKLRTRKIRTIITVILASLLFGVLVAASLIVTGAFKSIDSFRQDGLTSRYIVGVTKAPGDPLALQKVLHDPTLITEAKTRYEALVEKKTTEAKHFGLSYSQASDQPPYIQMGNDTSTTRLSINDPNGIVHELLAEKYSSQPAFDDTQLQSVAGRYHATSIFTSENYTTANGSSLAILPKDGEAFYDQSDATAVNEHYQVPILQNQLVISPPQITTPFMLPHNAGWEPSNNTLPIILPQNAVEQLLGLEKLPNTADATMKLDRLKEVHQKAMTITFQACYRNSASLALIQQTIQQQKDISTYTGDKTFQQPPLIYSLPNSQSCQNPNVKTDTRTASEKKNDDNQKLFDHEFGKDTTPVSYFVTFKVVGISPAEQSSPNQQSQQNRNLSDIMNNLLETSGVGQTVPESLYDQIPEKNKYSDLFTYTPLYLFGNEDNKQRYIEFTNASDATKFIDEQSCTTQYDNTCRPLGRPYQASLSFSNSAALDDIRAKITIWFGYAVIGVITLAAVIMWIAIGRTIADGRHETAVFRAIGFKRIDISMVYILYTAMLSGLVTLFAGSIGFVSALIANQKLAPTLTAQAQYGFGGIDLSKEVNLIGINQQQLCLLLIACLVTGLFSAVIPLLRNVRRSPIRDMREE